MAARTDTSGSAAGRVWQGMSPAAREADRRARLVEAGMGLVGTQGTAALTMRAACRDAAVGPRYFYELFADRDALLAAVYDEAVERIRGPVLEAAVEGSAAGGVRAAVVAAFDAAVALAEADPRIGRVLWREAAADDVLRPRSRDAMPEFIVSVAAAVIPERVPELREPGRAWMLIGLSAAMFALFLAWSEGLRPTSREVFVQHCADFALEQLGLGA